MVTRAGRSTATDGAEVLLHAAAAVPRFARKVPGGVLSCAEEYGLEYRLVSRQPRLVASRGSTAFALLQQSATGSSPTCIRLSRTFNPKVGIRGSPGASRAVQGRDARHPAPPSSSSSKRPSQPPNSSRRPRIEAKGARYSEDRREEDRPITTRLSLTRSWVVPSSVLSCC